MPASSECCRTRAVWGWTPVASGEPDPFAEQITGLGDSWKGFAGTAEESDHGDVGHPRLLLTAGMCNPYGVMGRHGAADNSYAPAVEYGVSIELKPPADSPHLDPLQVEGAGSLLDRILDQVDGAEDADGEDVAVLDRILDQVDGAEDADSEDVAVDRYWVGAHPEGALVLVVVDADSLEIAEAAAREIMVEVLQRSELLTSWRITGCEVGFDQRFAEAGLQAADGPGVPPEDPAERARWHAEQRQPAAVGDEPVPFENPVLATRPANIR